MSYGFVYLLNNEIMPDIYKIGHTEKSPHQRCLDLSSKTAVPVAYNVVFYGEVWNAQSLEFELHKMWENKRVNDNREFFKLNRKEVYSICEFLKENCKQYVECEEYHMICHSMEVLGEL